MSEPRTMHFDGTVTHFDGTVCLQSCVCSGRLLARVAELEAWRNAVEDVVDRVEALEAKNKELRAALVMWSSGKAFGRADVWTITNNALKEIEP
jgi:hypothetical protein